MAFKTFKKIFGGGGVDASDDEYLEIDLSQEKKENKVVVKLFNLNDYEDSNMILNALREGYTIAIIDIRNLKKKDPIELKRAISKIKKTSDALEGSIAGFGENIVVVTPSFAKVEKHIPKVKEEKKSSLEDF
ncbi:cell division protein SepF [Candidatus Pacearchaeota archaeon]|nr:cell division protein SepF [Candidatus Pacearchaeota archaeon]